MNRLRTAVLLFWLNVMPLAPLTAQTVASGSATGSSFRVDDSGTVVLDPVLAMRWRPVGRSGASSIVSANTRVGVQLNLASWIGRSGRIYMSLPRTSGPSVRGTWTTGGAMLAGTLISGDRTLVYAGPITGPILRDQFNITLEADGTRLTGPEALGFGFEIDLD
ncbi:hypothetical protein [Sphingomonas glacialis]|uniref:hypothetical protein n=1 Tax=Sphingomonas glacialis TaxID=658225 RepID=UPI001386ED29|nr:hypothetical protein [Sphingomonas glacialis]